MKFDKIIEGVFV